MKDDDLHRMYPEFQVPIRCENGCGAVFELVDGYNSYKRHMYGGEMVPLLICECCAAEEGHIYEHMETPEESPVCRRKPKTKLR